ncbi:GNAT family N-acetyltransferase (plasmid) [Haloferacaceae archaeon DSL9]
MTETYAIRRYDHADRDEFLTLFDEVFDAWMGGDWFEWKYDRNPYAEEVPIVVAEHDGSVVGARSFFALPVAAGSDRYLAFQPCDTMVHPEHQRQGLFTRMTETAIEWYSDDIDLFFNFPNHRSLPGNLKLGWEIVSEQERYYRVQNPAAWISQLEPVEPLARRIAGAYLAAKDRLAGSSDEFDLEWYDRVPSAQLASLAATETHQQFHVARDEQFYEWRFANPIRAYETVVATDGGSPVAAVIYVKIERPTGVSAVRFIDVLPLSGEQNARRTAALSSLVGAICRRHGDVDLLVAPGETIPEAALRAYGFYSDKQPPLGLVATPTTHVVRPPGEDPREWTLGGRRLDDPDNWLRALCEVDSE